MTTTNEQSLETADDAQLPVPASGASPPRDGFDSQEPSIASHTPAIVQDSAPSQIQDERRDSSVTPDEPPVDPQIATLLGMFPDFDQSLLQSVLQSVSGDQERAIDVLLGMSDPEYKPTTHSSLTQTELDEQFARSLLQEEQQRSWTPRVTPAPAPYPQQTVQFSETNDRPRATENESMAQIQEQLGKFAETGKRTFNTLFSKVKAKIQEFDNPPQQGNASGSGNPLPHGDYRSTPAQAQYYDPNPPQSYQGYDVTVQEPQNGVHMAQDVTTGTVNPAAPATTTATNAPAPAGNVDRSKIGLLPKRPVSLGSSAQPSRNADEDDVEYVENPFEDGRRR